MVEKPSQSSGPYLVQLLKTSTWRLGGERESGLNDDGARPLIPQQQTRCDCIGMSVATSGLTHRGKRQRYLITLSASVSILSGRPLDRVLFSLSLFRVRA